MIDLWIRHAVEHHLGVLGPRLDKRSLRGRLRLETDFKERSGCRGQTLKRLCRWPGSTALKPGNHRLGGIHTLRELLLSEASREPRSNDRAGQCKLRREFCMGLAVFLVFQPFLVKVVDFGQFTISFARFKASSISRPGVFCVFLMNTRTTTTRLPTAVT